VAGQDLSEMPLVAELRRQETTSTPLAEKKKKGAKRWVVAKWLSGGAAVVAGVVTALQ